MQGGGGAEEGGGGSRREAGGMECSLCQAETEMVCPGCSVACCPLHLEVHVREEVALKHRGVLEDLRVKHIRRVF